MVVPSSIDLPSGIRKHYLVAYLSHLLPSVRFMQLDFHSFHLSAAFKLLLLIQILDRPEEREAVIWVAVWVRHTIGGKPVFRLF